MEIKLNISPCPNDTFMFDALINGRIDTCGLSFEVEYLDIEELNKQALRGEAQMTKLSCAVLSHISNNYELCDSGAALGRGNGPLLVRRQGDTQPMKRVATPGEYTTANALLGRLYPDIEERVPMLFSDVAEAVARGDVDAGVLIHEGRFVYRNYDLELVADLGELWEQCESLPLPLGCIVMHKALPQDIRQTFERVLRNSIEYAFEHPEVSRDYIKSHAQELDDDVITSHIKLFVNSYSLSLGDEGRMALQKL